MSPHADWADNVIQPATTGQAEPGRPHVSQAELRELSEQFDALLRRVWEWNEAQSLSELAWHGDFFDRWAGFNLALGIAAARLRQAL